MALHSPLLALVACLAAACVTEPPPRAPSSSKPASTSVTEVASATESAPATEPAAVECKLYCEPWEMLPRLEPGPDYTKHEIDNARSVLDAMRDDLLACYKKRLRVSPDAHALITVDISIGEDGHVRRVDTAGGGVLGEGGMGCIVHRIQQGVFEPPHGGGTLHVRVPFSLRRVAPGDEDDST